MAAVANARRSWLTATRAHGRKFLGPALFAASVAARVADVPALRQPGEVMRKLAAVLKGPKQLRAKARAQINRIDQVIASIEAEVSADIRSYGENYELYLYESQEFVDELGRLRKILAVATNKGHGRQLAEQSNIIETLDVCEERFSEANRKLWEARWRICVKVQLQPTPNWYCAGHADGSSNRALG
ncbi:unnamed protein product [Rhizoctonia solani]|uniref:Uncharacterized protein n=1 Tax=Rhizoctonia solani TaxID=456999 RepID=A0A8H3HQW9_9AGAM|nr:unnamed protein product [Rhizoctonia solani]